MNEEKIRNGKEIPNSGVFTESQIKPKVPQIVVHNIIDRPLIRRATVLSNENIRNYNLKMPISGLIVGKTLKYVNVLMYQVFTSHKGVCCILSNAFQHYESLFMIIRDWILKFS